MGSETLTEGRVEKVQTMQSIADGLKDSRQEEHSDFSIPCPNAVGAQGIAPGRTAVRPYSTQADNCNIRTIVDHRGFFNTP